jgi:hypothetical protein
MGREAREHESRKDGSGWPIGVIPEHATEHFGAERCQMRFASGRPKMRNEMRNARGRKERERRQRWACPARPQICNKASKAGIDYAAAKMRRALHEATARYCKIDRRTRRVDQCDRACGKLGNYLSECVGKLRDRGHRAQIEARRREPRSALGQDGKVEEILTDVYPGEGDAIAEGDDTGTGA